MPSRALGPSDLCLYVRPEPPTAGGPQHHRSPGGSRGREPPAAPQALTQRRGIVTIDWSAFLAVAAATMLGAGGLVLFFALGVRFGAEGEDPPASTGAAPSWRHPATCYAHSGARGPLRRVPHRALLPPLTRPSCPRCPGRRCTAPTNVVSPRRHGGLGPAPGARVRVRSATLFRSRRVCFRVELRWCRSRCPFVRSLFPGRRGYRR